MYICSKNCEKIAYNMMTWLKNCKNDIDPVPPQSKINKVSVANIDSIMAYFSEFGIFR